MPFLLQDSNTFIGPDPAHVVTKKEYLKWRNKHFKRANKVKQTKLVDFKSDATFVDFNKNDLLNILPNAPSTEDYLGLLFNCTIIKGNYCNLTILASHSEASHSETLQFTHKEIIDHKNTSWINEYHCENYRNRIRQLRRCNEGEYGKRETTGVYHLASETITMLKEIPGDIVRFTFIMDKKKSTVLISGEGFDLFDDLNNLRMFDPVLYDHGTSCCSIEQ
tara:strand:- start:661 stop:1323 length:663 start_codon:yes stop_codon:yes gene_type:complete